MVFGRVGAVWFGNVGVGAIGLVRLAWELLALGQRLLFALVPSALKQWVLSAYNLSGLVGPVGVAAVGVVAVGVQQWVTSA